MRRVRARRGALAGVAAGAFAAAVAFPAALGEGRRALVDADHAATRCAGIPAGPGPAALVDRIDDQLAPRMPQLDDAERETLACTIVREAGAARIDPLLVLALIETESAFDAGALSGRGARGLMQLREGTMRREAERSGFSYDSPHEPVANVQAGVRYLRRLLDAFGREEVALMAYNAGPNRILGYLRAGGIPDRFHVYPRRVRTELHRLRRLMGAEPAPMVADAAPLPVAAAQ